MQIEHDHVSMESELEFHWTEIMSNLNDFNALLGTDFTPLSSRNLITDKTINAITKSLIEDDGKIEISKLAPYITRKAITRRKWCKINLIVFRIKVKSSTLNLFYSINFCNSLTFDNSTILKSAFSNGS